MRVICCVGLIGGLLAVAASSAVADPPTPANCTFSEGVTVCSTSTSSTASVVSQDPGNSACVDTIPVTTTVTTYTAHRGAPDGHGPQVAAPPAMTTVTYGAPTVDCGPLGGAAS